MVLFGEKEKHPARPKVPRHLPRRRERSASAASSTTAMARAPAISRMRSIAAARPLMWTGTKDVMIAPTPPLANFSSQLMRAWVPLPS